MERTKRRLVKKEDKKNQFKGGNSKATKKFNIISKIIGMVFFVVIIVFTVMLVKINVLPMKYLISCFVIAFATTLFVGLSIFINHKKLKLKFIVTIISGILILILAIVSAYMYRTINFLKGIDDTNSSYNEKTYMVIVLQDSKYNKVQDLQDTKMLYYDNELDNVQVIIEKIGDVVTVELVPDESIIDMGQQLLNKKTESIIIEESYKKTLEEEVESFGEKVKVIYTFSIPIELATVDSKEVKVSSNSFNIYISGIDTYGSIATVSRSDVNMVVTVNPNTHQILLTNIPRDYYVKLHGKTGYRDKLTHAGIYGTEMSIKTIEDLLDIDINYYFKVNFTSLVDIVNAIGGVEVYSQYTFRAISGEKFKEGYNKMNGSEALAFSRERKSFLSGDRARGQNQQAVIDAMIKKISTSTILTKFDSLLKSVEGKFRTNMPYTKMLELVKMQISDMPKWTVTSISLDGAGSMEYTYSMGKQKLSVLIPYKEMITAAQNLIDAVMDGEELEGAYKEIVTVKKTLVVAPTPKEAKKEEIEEVEEEAIVPIEPEKPVTEKPVTEEPVTEEPVTEEPITEEPITEEPETPTVPEPPTPGGPITPPGGSENSSGE